MAYPDDKEIFRRVVGEDLAAGIPGDIVTADDRNKPVDFLERLQDTLGVGIKGGEVNLNDRIKALEDSKIYSKGAVNLLGDMTFDSGSLSHIVIPTFSPLVENDVVFLRVSFGFYAALQSSDIQVSFNHQINGSGWIGMDNTYYFRNVYAGKTVGFIVVSKDRTATQNTFFASRLVFPSVTGTVIFKSIVVEILVV